MMTATEMANRLSQLSGLLLEEKLIQSDSVTVIHKVVAQLKGQRKNQGWRYSITPTDPVRFCPTNTKKASNVQASLQMSLLVTDARQKGMEGWFSELNTTLELHIDGNIIDRWHIDLANKTQEGPVFHLQHGGHSSGNSMRQTEGKLSVPRWMHPPMDIVLACELVVANLFQEQWLRLRKNPTWTALVRDAESFCYEDYFKAVSNHYSDQSRKETLLQRFWVS